MTAENVMKLNPGGGALRVPADILRKSLESRFGVPISRAFIDDSGHIDFSHMPDELELDDVGRIVKKKGA